MILFDDTDGSTVAQNHIWTIELRLMNEFNCIRG